MGSLPLNDQSFDFVSDFYHNRHFEHVRRSFAEEQLPYPPVCLRCNYLDAATAPRTDLIASEIEWMQIETSAACNLKCPFCRHGIPKSERESDRSGPQFLPYSLYEKVLTDIKAAGLNIKWMYFSGQGEPGINPDAWRMVELAKLNFDTNFLVNTNGNIPYSDLIVDSGLDKIKIAIESVDQTDYSRYRVNGNIEKIFDLTRRIAERKRQTGSKTPAVIWQCVLFSYNDSDESLLALRDQAKACGADSLALIRTWTDGHSHRSKDELARLFPEISDRHPARNAEDYGAVSFIDSLDMYSLPLEALRRSVADLTNAQSPAACFDLAFKILHWLQLDQKNWDSLSRPAEAGFSDPVLYEDRSNDPNFTEYMAGLAACFTGLSRIFAERGSAGQADLYETYRQQLDGVLSSHRDRQGLHD